MNIGSEAIHPDAALMSGAALASMPMHRLRAARRQESVSLRTISRKLQISCAEAAKQERETTDLPLSVLYRWQAALEVPLSELLLGQRDGLSEVVQFRAQMVRLMRTVRTIQENARQGSIRRMAESMIGQLLDMVPELQAVQSWPSVGQRRRRDELGTAVQRGLDFLLTEFE